MKVMCIILYVIRNDTRPIGRLSRTNFLPQQTRRLLQHPIKASRELAKLPKELLHQKEESQAESKPNIETSDTKWIKHLCEHYKIQPRFAVPKQVQRFSAPDYYAAISINNHFRKAFNEMIDYYESHEKTFSPEQILELNKLYKLGFIKPFKNLAATKFSSHIRNIDTYFIQKGKALKPSDKQALLEAYYIWGNLETNPSIDTALHYLRTQDFQLPEILTEDRSKDSTKLYNQSSFRRRNNNRKSREMPLVELVPTVRPSRFRPEIQTYKRQTVDGVQIYRIQTTDIDQVVQTKEPILVNRTPRVDGRKKIIQTEIDSKKRLRFIREELQNHETQVIKPSNPETMTLSFDKAKQYVTDYYNSFMNLGLSNESLNGFLDGPDPGPIETKFEDKDLLKEFSNKLRIFRYLYELKKSMLILFINDLGKAKCKKSLRELEKALGDILVNPDNLTKRQKEFLILCEHLKLFKLDAQTTTEIPRDLTSFKGGLNGHRGGLQPLFSLETNFQHPIREKKPSRLPWKFEPRTSIQESSGRSLAPTQIATRRDARVTAKTFNRLPTHLGSIHATESSCAEVQSWLAKLGTNSIQIAKDTGMGLTELVNSPANEVQVSFDLWSGKLKIEARNGQSVELGEIGFLIANSDQMQEADVD